MKTITLIYINDQASQAALNEIENIKNKYSDKILNNNIHFILKTDLEFKEIDETINTYPTLILIDDLEVIKIEGYDLENLNNNYWEYFLDFFKLRDLCFFASWKWNEEKWIWEPPISKPAENKKYWDEYEKVWLDLKEKIEKEQETQPYNSWIYDEGIKSWQPPVPRPNSNNFYNWNEEEFEWVLGLIQLPQEINNEN